MPAALARKNEGVRPVHEDWPIVLEVCSEKPDGLFRKFEFYIFLILDLTGRDHEVDTSVPPSSCPMEMPLNIKGCKIAYPDRRHQEQFHGKRHLHLESSMSRLLVGALHLFQLPTREIQEKGLVVGIVKLTEADLVLVGQTTIAPLEPTAKFLQLRYVLGGHLHPFLGQKFEYIGKAMDL